MSFDGKPILGIVGGIGSGKSHVARVFGSLGCVVIDSDAAAHAVYALPIVRETLRRWYGDAVFDKDGLVDRRAIARRVFSDVGERGRLEGLLHPLIHDRRRAEMEAARGDASVIAFVWDSPLLFEAGLDRDCDGVVFVDTPEAVRQRRVQTSRGWDAGELSRREANQMPLDEKRSRSTWTLPGDTDDETLRREASHVLSLAVAGVR